METISIIGIGRLGGALAIALSRAGFAVDQLVYRSEHPDQEVLRNIVGPAKLVHIDRIAEIDSDILIISTGDDDLSAVSKLISSKISGNCFVLHTSGALSSEILAPIARLGNHAGSIHPLVSISDPIAGADMFGGAYFSVEGDPLAVACAEKLAKKLGGRSFSIETRFKPLYHASAVMASGHLTSLISAAVEMLSHCGLDETEAKRVLLPLIESAVENISRQPLPSALTGPFARTDLNTIETHLAAFDDAGLSTLKKIYLELGIQALRVAEMNGRDGESIERIRDAIKLAQQSGK